MKLNVEYALSQTRRSAWNTRTGFIHRMFDLFPSRLLNREQVGFVGLEGVYCVVKRTWEVIVEVRYTASSMIFA